MSENVNCPICFSKDLNNFLNRSGIPVHQNLLMQTQAEARSITCGNLTMHVCGNCGFVFNQDFELDKINYGEKYDNDQAHSATFQSHLDDLVNMLINEHGVKDCKIVEVGCGQGNFLKRIVEAGNNVGMGFDPSFKGDVSQENGKLQFRSSYYDETCAGIKADIVICRHVIEHVPSPLELIKTVRRALVKSNNTKVFFETPCVDWILKNQVVWDFFYEHCSLFTTDSLTTAFQNAGFSVQAVGNVFGGQYLWLEATVGDTPSTLNPGDTPSMARLFGEAEQKIIQNWGRNVDKIKQDGGLALWGAGAKGATFANLIDPNQELIEAIVDINPNKQGKYIAGSGHPIISYKELKQRNIKTLLIMNPNYLEEIKEMLMRQNIKGVELKAMRMVVDFQ